MKSSYARNSAGKVSPTEKMKQTQSSFQREQASIGLSGAAFGLVETPDTPTSECSAQIIAEPRKQDDGNDKSRHPGFFAYRAARSSGPQPAPLPSSKSLKSAGSVSPTAKTKGKEKTQSSSQREQASIALSGAAFGLVETPDARPSERSAQTIADARKQDDSNDKKSRQSGSSACSTAHSPGSQPTPPPSCKSLRRAGKRSPTVKTKDKEQMQSSSEQGQPSIGLSGAAFAVATATATPSKEERTHSLTDLLKRENRNDEKGSGGSSPVRSKARSPRSESTSSHSPRRTLSKRNETDSSRAQKQNTPSSSSKRQRTEPSVTASGLPKTPDTHRKEKNGHVTAKSSKRSSTNDAASTRHGTSIQMRPSLSPRTPSLSTSRRAHEEATTNDQARNASGVKSAKKEAHHLSSHTPSSTIDRRDAPASDKGHSTNPSILQAPCRPGARTLGSVSPESPPLETVNRPKKYSRLAYAIGGLGLEASSLLLKQTGWQRSPTKPEDILKLLDEDQPKSSSVNVPDGKATPEKPRTMLGSNFKEWYHKFSSTRSTSPFDSPPAHGETPDTSSARKNPASRKSSRKTVTDKSSVSRHKDRTSEAGANKGESPASVSSKTASKYSTKSRRSGGAPCHVDITKGGHALDDQTEPSMKDESSGGYWKRIKQTHGISPLVLAVVVVAALCVALSLRLLRSSKGPAPQELLADFPEAIYGFCTTSSCQQAVNDVKAALNSSVVPCQDIYGFACGNWQRIANTTEISGVRMRLSYMQGLEENLLRFLEKRLLTSTQDSNDRKIGVAYKSCVTFYTNQSAELTDMWPAALIKPEAWLAARDHVQLIDMVVDSILLNHLPSIFALVYHANRTVDIKIGTGIRDKSLFTLGQYMMTAKNFPGNDWYRARQAEIKTFNDAVNDICKQYQGIENPFVSVSTRYFKRDPVAALFSGAIAKHLHSASKPAAKVIRYPDDSSVLHMANTYGKFDVKLAAVYLLHVPFAELVNFEKESSVLRGNYGHSKTRSVCADYMHGLFKNAFHTMVSTPRSSSDFLTYVNGVWKRMQEAAAGRPFAGGVRLKEDPVPPNAAITLHGTVGNIDNVPEGALRANYGNDFIINLILYTRYTGVQVNIDMEDTWNVDAVDPKLLQAPFYYAEATEPYVNYATMGVSIAQALFKESVPQEALNSPYFAACFSTYGLSHMRVVFDGRNWPQYAGLAWSLETAIDAALGVGRRSAELERFMIVRYAHTYCGEETAARQPLTYVVKSSKTFARAFGCAVPPYPYC